MSVIAAFILLLQLKRVLKTNFNISTSDLMSKKIGLYRQIRNEKDLDFKKQERDKVEDLDY